MSNHFAEWMGGTRFNFWWLIPIKTHYRKVLVIEKELTIDYLMRVKTDVTPVKQKVKPPVRCNGQQPDILTDSYATNQS